MQIKPNKMYKLNGDTVTVTSIIEKISEVDNGRVVGKTPPEVKITVSFEWDRYGPKPLTNTKTMKLSEFKEQAQGPTGTPNYAKKNNTNPVP